MPGGLCNVVVFIIIGWNVGWVWELFVGQGERGNRCTWLLDCRM